MTDYSLVFRRKSVPRLENNNDYLRSKLIHWLEQGPSIFENMSSSSSSIISSGDITRFFGYFPRENSDFRGGERGEWSGHRIVTNLVSDIRNFVKENWLSPALPIDTNHKKRMRVERAVEWNVFWWNKREWEVVFFSQLFNVLSPSERADQQLKMYILRLLVFLWTEFLRKWEKQDFSKCFRPHFLGKTVFEITVTLKRDKPLFQRIYLGFKFGGASPLRDQVWKHAGPTAEREYPLEMDCKAPFLPINGIC